VGLSKRTIIIFRIHCKYKPYVEDRDDGLNTCDDIDRLLHDTFKNVVEGFNEQHKARDGMNK